MSVTLDATVGGTSANSFVSLEDAESYFEGRPFASAWTAASESTREQALVFASRILNRMKWAGNKGSTTNTASTQALAWPRRWSPSLEYDAPPDWVSAYFVDTNVEYYSSLTMPTPLKDATCELALEVLNAGTSDPFVTDSTRNIKSETVGPLSTTYFDPSDRAFGLSRFPAVMSIIAPLLRSSGAMVVERV